MRRFWITLALATVGLGHVPVVAQGPPSAMTRVRLRIESPGGGTRSGPWVVGNLARVNTDTLWLRVARPDGPLASIDRASIRALETSRGRRRHPGQGALWGAGAGLGLGLLALTALDDCAVATGGWSFDICGNNEDVVLLGSVVAGAAWGAVVGLLITTERWVAMPGLQLAPVATRHGLGLALQLSARRRGTPAPPSDPWRNE